VESADKLETEELGVLRRELASTEVRSAGGAALLTALFMLVVDNLSPTTLAASLPRPVKSVGVLRVFQKFLIFTL
jgi:hypothetical protein